MMTKFCDVVCISKPQWVKTVMQHSFIVFLVLFFYFIHYCLSICPLFIFLTTRYLDEHQQACVNVTLAASLWCRSHLRARVPTTHLSYFWWIPIDGAWRRNVGGLGLFWAMFQEICELLIPEIRSVAVVSAPIDSSPILPGGTAGWLVAPGLTHQRPPALPAARVDESAAVAIFRLHPWFCYCEWESSGARLYLRDYGWCALHCCNRAAPDYHTGKSWRWPVMFVYFTRH